MSLPARHRAANKAQENPYGALVVFLLFLAAVLLSSVPGRSFTLLSDGQCPVGRYE
ncbi:MAG: hypothetical protein LW804_08790 [Cryomorphaceae bacterium]|nr:hypothetical protein [Cryomorphaceae bacterium]